MAGSNRSFGYDAAATFANFIATPSLWDAFAVRTVIPTVPIEHVATNDHVLLSLLSHLVYSATGTRNEVVYRLLPALAAGATVGVSTTALSRRFGLVAGLSAGLFIATDPLFVDNGRDLRGYSLAALGSVGGTLVVAGSWSWQRLAGYALVMGLAIAAQLFAGVVLLCHAAWVLAARRAEARRFAPAWLGAAAIGVAANASIYITVLSRHGLPPPYFNPTFPRDTVLFLLGAPVLLTVGLWLATAGLGVWTQRRQLGLWSSLAVLAIVTAVLWLGLKPAFLYPRFFVFLVPGVAFLMASAVARWWVLAPVVVVGAVASVIGEAPTYLQAPLALPQAAAVANRLDAEGKTACVLHSDEQVLAAYTYRFAVVTNANQLGGCDAVIVVSWNVDLPVRDEAARELPRLTTLPAYYPGVVLER
jgi:MFS family permease